MKMRTRYCQNCGTEFAIDHQARKYCITCRPAPKKVGRPRIYQNKPDHIYQRMRRWKITFVSKAYLDVYVDGITSYDAILAAQKVKEGSKEELPFYGSETIVCAAEEVEQ